MAFPASVQNTFDDESQDSDSPKQVKSDDDLDSNDTGTPSKFPPLQHVYSTTAMISDDCFGYPCDPEQQHTPIEMYKVFIRRGKRCSKSSYYDSLVEKFEPPPKKRALLEDVTKAHTSVPSEVNLDPVGEDFDAPNVAQTKKRRIRAGEAAKLGIHSNVRTWIRSSCDGVNPITFVGLRCQIYWPKDDEWYQGYVTAYGEESKRHHVVYEDGEEEDLMLSREEVKFYISHEEMLQLNLRPHDKSLNVNEVDYSESPEHEPGLQSLSGAYQPHTGYSMDKRRADGAHEPCIWSSPAGGSSLPIGKHIFCNRSLNMKNIVAVGFDMDYTLAQYKPETFEALAYEGTVKKLVHDLGYPSELLNWSFDWKYMLRGLVLDKKRGNILKMDRHKYVKVAYHGFREMSKEEKVGTYGNTLIRDSFDEPDYALIDTLFSLAEAYLFAQLVDFIDNNPGKVPSGTDYARMYRDVRAAVDLCHRDGTLKRMVAKDPSRYINDDTSILPMLKMLRDCGRSTFLVTNSLWDYTNTVMNFLCRTHTSNNGTSPSFDWLQYFDVVITGSAKPGFFHEENRANLFEVAPESGMLLNTDNGTPMPQVGNVVAKVPEKGPDDGCRVFQGGNVAHLHKLLNVESSSQVLYVGDHIYGDILRSKKVLGWRTMLVVPELETEVELLWELRNTRNELRVMRNERDQIEDLIHHLQWSLKFEDLKSDQKEKLSLQLNDQETKREKIRGSHQVAQRELHHKFHKVWGQLMKTGYQNSRFAHQVERFACLYTSEVTNLSLYSPDKYYRPSEDFMPHEFEILTL